MFVTDYVVFHREAIVLDLGHPGSDGHCIRVCERYLKPAIRCGENGTNTAHLHVLQQIQPFEVRNPSTLEKAKVSGVIKVTERIHLSPRDRSLNHDGTLFEQVNHNQILAQKAVHKLAHLILVRGDRSLLQQSLELSLQRDQADLLSERVEVE